MAFISPLVISPLLGNYKIPHRIMWRNGEPVIKRVLRLDGIITPKVIRLLAEERMLYEYQRIKWHYHNLL